MAGPQQDLPVDQVLERLLTSPGPDLRRYRRQMVLLLGITAVDSAIVVVSTLILRLIIDDGILRHRESVAVTLALTVAGLALVASARGT